ncbi:DUF2235 domain-containing protein [Rhizobium mayense]|uniref:DUF2235 domain-containing protein n=1 Tax=Rhizobium mayense TaxID=1312184 RepID=A0ABT7K4N6_9HYPH|nr:DUF2235 domain-containing protein [Rhizobium mayense]MDL2403112.1 DUF2235 domain-containing protein [Rhizobium mayense]
MSKNIVVCCDGTNNQLNGDLTNVVRMFEVVVKDDRQTAFYDPGVGTMADPFAQGPVRKRWSMIKRLAFGAGLDDNVRHRKLNGNRAQTLMLADFIVHARAIFPHRLVAAVRSSR